MIESAKNENCVWAADVDKFGLCAAGHAECTPDDCPHFQEIVENVEIIERPYTLRKLKDGDLIPLLGLFRKLGLKEFKDVVGKVANGGSVEEIGLNAIMNIGDVIIENLEGNAGEAIYDFWSGLSGIPVDEIKEMEFGTLPLMIYDSFSEVKNASFFKVLAKLL